MPIAAPANMFIDWVVLVDVDVDVFDPILFSAKLWFPV